MMIIFFEKETWAFFMVNIHFFKSLLVPNYSLLDGYNALSVCTIARCQEFLKKT